MYQIIHCMVSTEYVLFFGENYILSIVMSAPGTEGTNQLVPSVPGADQPAGPQVRYEREADGHPTHHEI
jgi:hypothetical protein